MILRQWLDDALKGSAERQSATLRLTLSCLLLTLLFLSFQLPFLAVAIIVVFYVTQKNVVLTAGIGLGFVVVALLALGGMLLIIKYTYDTPLIRLVASLFLFFWAMFFMRVLGKLGLAFFVVALVLIYAQTFPSMTGESEIIVRLILWLWMSMVVAIVVTVLVNACFIQAYPHYQYCQCVAALCQQTADRLQGINSGEQPVGIFIAEQLNELQSLYKFACLTNSDFKEKSKSWYSLSNLALKSLALAELYHVNPGKADTQQVTRLAEHFRQLATQARQREIGGSSPVAIATADKILEELSQLCEQFRVTRSIAPLPGQTEKPPLMAVDAWRNPLYLQFALKTLLASLLCYLFYTATAWQGVHTIMLSCVIVAQPGLGATYQKAGLRVVGALGAAVVAVIGMVFIQPHLDTIVGLLLMCLPIFAFSAWLAAGSERVAYAGIQFGFTFALLFLSGFGPMSNLTELRDRVIGIILGVIVASIVYLYLWPDSDAPRLQKNMARLYRQLGRYCSQRATDGPPLQIYQQIEQVTELASRLDAEPLASTTHPYRCAVQWPIKESLEVAQRLAILVSGYSRYATSDDPFLNHLAHWLQNYANAIDGEVISPLPVPLYHNPYGDALLESLRQLRYWQPISPQLTQEHLDGD